MLDDRKSALWQALGLGPEWVLREELQELRKEQTKRDVPSPTLSPVPSKISSPQSDPSSSRSTSSSTITVNRTLPEPKKGQLRRREGRGVREEAFSPTRATKIKQSSWAEIITEVKNCHLCDISQQRICAVPGEGLPPKDLVLIGEAPGAEEDRQGVPFCGPSGKLLTTILHAIGLERGKDLGILNTIKCRPPMNADPSAEEMAACWGFLERQLELMDPKVIVAMGKPAAKSLFGTDETLTSRRQKVFDMVIAGKSRKIIVTYHPAALLRNPLDKRKAWVDWCLVLDTLNKARNEQE